STNIYTILFILPSIVNLTNCITQTNILKYMYIILMLVEIKGEHYYDEYKMIYMDRYCHIISYCNSLFYQNIYQTIKKWANEREQSFFTEMKESDLLLDYKTSAHFSLESQIKPIKDNI